MSVLRGGGGPPEPNLRLAQFALQTLDGPLLLIHLRSAVLQLCLKQLCGLPVVGHPAVSFGPILLQLCYLDAEGLRGTNSSMSFISIWIQRSTKDLNRTLL